MNVFENPKNDPKYRIFAIVDEITHKKDNFDSECVLDLCRFAAKAPTDVRGGIDIFGKEFALNTGKCIMNLFYQIKNKKKKLREKLVDEYSDVLFSFLTDLNPTLTDFLEEDVMRQIISSFDTLKAIFFLAGI